RHFSAHERAFDAALAESPEYIGGRLLASIGADEPESPLSHGRGERRPAEQPRVVVAVAPRVRACSARREQPLEHGLVVLRLLFLGCEILRPRCPEEIICNRAPRRS